MSLPPPHRHLEDLPGEAGALGLQPEEVMHPEELPGATIRPLHSLEVPPGVLLPHHGRLQLLHYKTLGGGG